MQGLCSNLNYHLEFDVNKISGDGFLGTGYDYPSSRALTHPLIEVVNYYDNYSFLTASILNGNSSQLTYTNTANANSLQTGCVRRTSSGKYVYTAYYYDEKGQMIRKQEVLHDGTLQITGTTYSFTGKPLVETSIINHNSQVNTITKRCSYYAGNDQVDTIAISHNGGTSHLVARYEYNDLGQTSFLHREGNAGDVSYTYDIHGWPVTISGKGFQEWLHYADGLGQPCYTGNISSLQWKSDGESFRRGFKFQYNDIGWMTKAEYAEGDYMDSHTNRYTEWVKEYTRNGDIRKLERYGKKADGIYGKIDNLRMYYTGCQIDSVKEDAAPVTRAGAFDFVSKTVSVNGKQYEYYDDGSLKWDANKGIALIEYDYNTYPRRVQFTDGSTTEYVYTVDGEKLQTVYRTAVPNMSVDLGSSVDLDSSNTLSVDSINYIGDFIIENGLLSKYLFNGGYMTFSNGQSVCHYYTKDHLGNNRAVVNSNGDIEQITHYYPFGAVFADAGYGDALQRYKYNGKELDRMHGLNFYDYGARQYDPLLCRFTRTDPLCEKHYDVCLYHFCHNNPINRIDSNGMDDFRLSTDGNLELLRKTNAKETDRIYAVNGGNITIGKKITKQMLTERTDYNGYYVEGKGNEIINLFYFVANNTNVEWKLNGYKSKNATTYLLATSHKQDRVTNTNGGNNELNLFISIHNHPGSSPAKASGYGKNSEQNGRLYSFGDDQYNVNTVYNCFKEAGKNYPSQFPFFYIYHIGTQTRIGYNPDKSRTTVKKIREALDLIK